jgi:hypothetical protein
MTRARTKAIEDKVNSLLFELPLSTHETWLLPQAETLCVIRYLEEGHGTATSNGQDGEDTEYEGQEEELPEKLQPADVRPGPDVRRLKAQPTQAPAYESYSERTSAQDRTSGDSSQRADVRPPPDDRRLRTRAESVEIRRQRTTGDRTTGPHRTIGATAAEPK